MTALAQNFTVWQGEDKDIQISVYEDTDELISKDITDAIISWIVKKKVNSVESAILKSTTDGITITSASEGKFTIVLKALNTIDLSPGKYYHEAKMVLGNRTEIILVGEITLMDSGF